MANPKLASNALLKPSQKTKGNSHAIEIPDHLTVSEKERLRKLEIIIENPGLAIGYALLEIREKRLYRGSFATFEAYCQRRWNFTRVRAHQYIDAARTVKELPEECKPLVNSERQVRALTEVPPDVRAEVLTQVSQTGKVTAKRITEAAKAVVQKITRKKPEQFKDKIGCPIPDDVLKDWREAESFDDLLKQVQRIKLRVSKALDDDELAFCEITNSTVADLHNAWSALQGLIPYAVCASCEGHNRENCTLCKQRGYLSKFAYEHFVSKKARELREGLYAA